MLLIYLVSLGLLGFSLKLVNRVLGLLWYKTVRAFKGHDFFYQLLLNPLQVDCYCFR